MRWLRWLAGLYVRLVLEEILRIALAARSKPLPKTANARQWRRCSSGAMARARPDAA